jgi:hypothetical protein
VGIVCRSGRLDFGLEGGFARCTRGDKPILGRSAKRRLGKGSEGNDSVWNSDEEIGCYAAVVRGRY